MQEKKLNLYQKMHQIMCETEAIKKDLSVGEGKNSYKAVGEKAVLNEIKPLLKKYGVILFPIKIEAKETVDSFTSTKQDYKTNERYLSESARLMTQVIATYKMVDIESGEFEILQTIGNGVDTQDKASGKAMTYAYKVLLQKTFMLFSGEDTDNEHSEDITNRQTKPQSKATTQTGKITEKQAKRLFAVASANKISQEQIKKDLEHLGHSRTTDLTVTEYNKLVDGYEGGAK